MNSRAILSALLTLGTAAALVVGSGSESSASERDRKFFSQIEGEWSGPGEIVAGKYKGTKFNCNFKGDTPNGKVGMSLDGGCRVGLFTQKMSASVIHQGKKGYRGTFMDGAIGEGLDVVGGNVTGEKVVLTLNRNQLNGAMLARLPNQNTMHVTVSVKVENQMVPVIGMSLKRVDTRAVGAISSN